MPLRRVWFSCVPSFSILRCSGDGASTREAEPPQPKERRRSWYGNELFLKLIGRSGRYGYPAPSQESSYSVDWNRLFDATPFYTPSRYLRVDLDALEAGDHILHAPHRFRKLSPMRMGMELYAFATWLSPLAVEEAFDSLKRYEDSNGFFPGARVLPSPPSIKINIERAPGIGPGDRNGFCTFESRGVWQRHVHEGLWSRTRVLGFLEHL